MIRFILYPIGNNDGRASVAITKMLFSDTHSVVYVGVNKEGVDASGTHYTNILKKADVYSHIWMLGVAPTKREKTYLSNMGYKVKTTSSSLETWKRFFPDTPIPYIISLINDAEGELKPQSDYFRNTFSMMSQRELENLLESRYSHDLDKWLAVGEIRAKSTTSTNVV